MHQSSSTTKRQKKRKVHLQTNLLYLKIITTKLLKVKDENGKVIADKKYADLTVKEKTSSSIYLQQNKPLTNRN
jgi:hypothetical protein